MTQTSRSERGADWNHTYVRSVTLTGLGLPVVGAFALIADQFIVGASAILAGLSTTFLMPKALRMILGKKHELDERELDLRMKAYEFSHRHIALFAALLFMTVAITNDYFAMPMPSATAMIGLAIAVSFYSIIVPLGYLAWTVTPPGSAGD